MEELVGKFANQFILTDEEKLELAAPRGHAIRRERYFLVGQVLSLKPICRDGLLKLFKMLWKDNGLRIGGLGDGRLVFEVSSVEAKNLALSGRPWHFDKSLLVIECANGRGPFNSIPLTDEFFWVQVHGLDPDDMTDEIGKLVGDYLGEFIRSDPGMDGVCMARFMRIRVKINVSKPLKRTVRIRINDKSQFYNLKYERLPNFCYICGCFNHLDVDCDKRDRSKALVLQHQFGSFLRADPDDSLSINMRPTRFFEPLKPAWSLRAPDFIDSVTGSVRNRSVFEADCSSDGTFHCAPVGGAAGVMDTDEDFGPTLSKRRRLSGKAGNCTPSEAVSTMILDKGVEKSCCIEKCDEGSSVVSALPVPHIINPVNVSSGDSLGTTVGSRGLKSIGTFESSEDVNVDFERTGARGSEKEGADVNEAIAHASTVLLAGESFNKIGPRQSVGPSEARIFKKWKARAREAGSCGIGPVLGSSTRISSSEVPCIQVFESLCSDAVSADTVVGSGSRTHHEQC